MGVLSGGERAKVCFAVMMLEHGNILILDEPTNHLDISMKEVIEDAMKTFTGTILFVSHDRYLLDQVADHILEIKPTGVKTYIGGFQSWLDATKKEAAAANAAAQAVETEKKKEDKQQTYRSKEQRAAAGTAVRGDASGTRCPQRRNNKGRSVQRFQFDAGKVQANGYPADRIGCSTGRDDFVGRGIGVSHSVSTMFC